MVETIQTAAAGEDVGSQRGKQGGSMRPFRVRAVLPSRDSTSSGGGGSAVLVEEDGVQSGSRVSIEVSGRWWIVGGVGLGVRQRAFLRAFWRSATSSKQVRSGWLCGCPKRGGCKGVPGEHALQRPLILVSSFLRTTSSWMVAGRPS